MHKFTEVTLIIPYYRNPAMLRVQLENWSALPAGYRFIVVDDGSPERAQDVVEAMPEAYLQGLRYRLQVYRIAVDIPWNRGGARNLGTHVAQSDWIIHTDIDHILPLPSALALLKVNVQSGHWYRFERYRFGRADETRRKDKIPTDLTFGKIHPHVDSYLCERSLYWRNGGYDEDYSGCLGGGNPFLAAFEKLSAPIVLPEPVTLHVYTRDVIADASDHTLSRDSSEYSRRRREKQRTGNIKPKNPLRFPWQRVM